MVLIAAFVVALVVTPLAMRLARRTGLLDRPGVLKIQTRPIPYLGGLAVAAGLAVGVVPARRALLLPLAMALALGVTDDARHLDPRLRLVAEAAIGAAVAAVLPTRLPGPLGFVLVAAVVVVMVNGLNMIDGLDAMAAGVAAVSALGFALVLHGDARTVALSLGGALAGFLVFNRPPARIYLGDGGAYLVGTAMAALLVMAWAPSRPLAVSLGSLTLAACPVGELAFAVVRRRRSRAPLWAGDRDHIYDQLVRRGWSTTRTVAAYTAAQALLAAIAVTIAAVRLHASVAAMAVATTALVLAVAVAASGFLAPTHPETAT